MHIAITGASSGMGKQLCKTYSKQHLVSACARSKSVSALGKSNYKSVDISNAKEVVNWASGVIDEFGPPELIINCASIILSSNSVWDIPSSDIENLLKINILGSIQVAQAFLPSMIENSRGGIVNFSSYWGRSPSGQQAAYSASKWAIEGFSASLAEELPKPLFCVALNPGVVNTPMLRKTFGAEASSYPSTADWIEDSADYILSLSRKENGKSLTVPGH